MGFPSLGSEEAAVDLKKGVKGSNTFRSAKMQVFN